MFSTATVDTARDFTGYTLQHLNMYPHSWSKAAHHFGVPLPESTVEQIKNTAIAQQVWNFYPTTKAIADKMLTLAQIQPHHSVLEPSAGAGDLANTIASIGVKKIDCFEGGGRGGFLRLSNHLVEPHPLLQKALKLQD